MKHISVTSVGIASLLVATVGFGLGSAYTMTHAQQQFADNAKTLSSLRSELASVKKTADSVPDVGQTVAQLNSAKTAGDAVAKIQSDMSDTSNDAGKLAGQMDQYLASDSTSMRTPWFIPSDGSSVSWSFQSTVASDATTLDALWTCTKNGDSDKVPVAFATATYDVNAKQFNKVSVKTTSAGTALIAPTPNASGDTSGSSIDALVDALDKLGPDKYTPESDANDMATAREKALEKWKQEHGQ